MNSGLPYVKLNVKAKSDTSGSYIVFAGVHIWLRTSENENSCNSSTKSKNKRKRRSDLQNADSQFLLILKAIVISYITF